jgi:hypothetical protein
MTFAIQRGVPAAGLLFAGTMFLGVAATLSPTKGDTLATVNIIRISSLAPSA